VKRPVRIMFTPRLVRQAVRVITKGTLMFMGWVYYLHSTLKEPIDFTVPPRSQLVEP
jgi:hypothetical protein